MASGAHITPHHTHKLTDSPTDFREEQFTHPLNLAVEQACSGAHSVESDTRPRLLSQALIQTTTHRLFDTGYAVVQPRKRYRT